MTERQMLVRATLAEVQRLRGENFAGADDLVLQLLQSYSFGDSLADLLWADLPEDAPVQDVADLLSLWSWRTDDNGSGIRRAAERWIEEGQSQKQVAVALNLDAYPFVDDGVRIANLQKTAEKFPELAQRCHEIITESRILMQRRSS
jgi:hypothetical protein